MKLNPSSILERLPSQARSRLEQYEALLAARGIPLGLIAAKDGGRLKERHILDSLRALDCFPRQIGLVVDVGSGAGLPGIPVAIAVPEARFVLVESRTRAVAFLELAVEALSLDNVSVLKGRAELLSLQADVALARAVGTPSASWTLARNVLHPRGGLVYFAGRTWSERQPDLPAGVSFRVCSPPLFRWQGPIVMMSPTDAGQEQRPGGQAG